MVLNTNSKHDSLNCTTLKLYKSDNKIVIICTLNVQYCTKRCASATSVLLLLHFHMQYCVIIMPLLQQFLGNSTVVEYYRKTQWLKCTLYNICVLFDVVQENELSCTSVLVHNASNTCRTVCNVRLPLTGMEPAIQKRNNYCECRTCLWKGRLNSEWTNSLNSN